VTIPIRLIDFDEKCSTDGCIESYEFSRRERALRAAKFFAVFFALALFSVIIPILHFILVPLFSLAAPATAVLTYLQKQEIEKAEGLCPYCSQSTKLPRAQLILPFTDSCDHCRQVIRVIAK
jgi:hypothetical protein